MANFTVDNGDSVTIDHTFNDTIGSIVINDGSCNVINDTDDTGLLLEFDSGGYIDVKSFGQFNVRGKLMELGVSDGTTSQTFQHWQNTHPINVIFIETGENTNKFEPWFAIDSEGVTLLEFSNFANNNISGRVYSWDNGAISFQKDDETAYAPPLNARVMAPNIIFSTTDPFSSTIAAKFVYDGGGIISIKNASFSDFSGTLSGMSKLDMEMVGNYGSLFIQYCSDVTLNETAAGFRDNYASGINISYCSNGKINNCSGVSVKSTAFSINYSKDFDVNGVFAMTAKRDSSSDSAYKINASTKIESENIVSVGGRTHIVDSSKALIKNIKSADSADFVEDTSYATYNFYIESSSESKIRDIEVLKNGGSYLGYFYCINSPETTVVKADIKSSHGSSVIVTDVSFGTRFSEIRFDGYSGSSPFKFSKKNNGVLLQSISSPTLPSISVEAKNAIFKGISASDVDLTVPNADGTNFYQTYTDDESGKLTFVMQRDSNETSFFASFLGGIKLSNDGKAYFSSAGDTIEVETPYRVKGVSFKNVDPSFIGQTTSALAFDYCIDTGNGYGSYKALNGDNLSSEDIDTSSGFLMKVRATAGSIEGTTYLNAIELETYDSRFVYPLDFELGRIYFNDIAKVDASARYYVYYSNGFGTSSAEMLKDIDGNYITGKVDAQDYIDFKYDFEGDASGGREPGEPFEVTVVLAGTNMAQNVVISQIFDAGQVNVFNIRPEKDYAYIG